MFKRVELILVNKQEIVILPRAKPTMAQGVPMAVIIKYSETKSNWQSGNIVRRVSRDLSKGIHSVNRVPRLNPQQCMYCHQIGHQINECPFIEDNVKQGFVEHFQNLNPTPVIAKNHEYSEPKELHCERVTILDRLRK
jgi:hypothetical protein